MAQLRDLSCLAHSFFVCVCCMCVHSNGAWKSLHFKCKSIPMLFSIHLFATATAIRYRILCAVRCAIDNVIGLCFFLLIWKLAKVHRHRSPMKKEQTLLHLTQQACMVKLWLHNNRSDNIGIRRYLCAACICCSEYWTVNNNTTEHTLLRYTIYLICNK